MYDFFEDKNITTEARVSLILNTFMYIDDCISIENFFENNRSIQAGANFSRRHNNRNHICTNDPNRIR